MAAPEGDPALAEQDAQDQEPDDAPPAPRRRRDGGDRIPLENLLRLLAGQRVEVHRRDAAGSHEELVQNLQRSGMLASPAVTRAMLLVPRGSFVPQAYQAEAWVDSPIRVEEEDFNISAPHMHAQMLESLDIQPGDRVLDVGCGCGFIAAAAAALVGRQGTVVGVDIKPACLRLSEGNISRLQASSSSYASSACPVSLLRHNIFIPSAKLKGKFNKVCVGATCPEDRLHLLLPLLEPGGGKLLAPVDNDLRLYTRGPDAKLRQRIVSSVRFSDLEVPSDASIALSVLSEEQAALMDIQVSEPSLSQDLAGGGGGAHQQGCGSGFMHMWSSCFSSAGSLESGSAHSLGSSGGSLPGPDTPMMAACRAAASRSSVGGSQEPPRATTDAPAGDEALCSSGGCGASDDASLPSADLDATMSDSPTAAGGDKHAFGAGQGQPDCQLVGHDGWKLWAHKHVLKSRAAHFHARLTSGMRDAHDCEHKVPDSFSHACMEHLLSYMYTDELPQGLDPPAVVQLLHAASYYGTPRLIELCEARLVQELLQLSPPAAAAEAPHLLSLADELGLVQLRRAAVAFIARHYKDVQRSEAWQTLERSQVELVASQLADEMSRLTQLLTDLEPPGGVAATPKRRGWW